MLKRASLWLPIVLLGAVAGAQEKPGVLTVEGRDGKQKAFSLEQLKQLPRQAVSVTDPHDKSSHRYEGVPVSALLAAVGAPSGQALHAAELRDYVEAAGADGYRVIFALAELDSLFQDNKVIVADTLDGKALEPSRGPLTLIAPQDHHPSRWVHSLVSLKVRQAP